MTFWRNSLWRDASPTGAVKDFVQVWNENPFRWRTLAVATAMTAGLMYIAVPKTERAPMPEPQIIPITTFAAGRTRDEIIASNIAHQKQEDAIRAQDEKRAEFNKQAWEAIGRATFIDVDSIKKKAAADEAARKKANDAIVAQNQARLEERAAAAGK
jgi:hypothetical protein